MKYKRLYNKLLKKNNFAYSDLKKQRKRIYYNKHAYIIIVL